MKSLLAVTILAVMVVTIQTQKPQRLPFEGVDVDNILKNEKLISKHIKCVRDEGRCDSNGKSLKTLLPRIINENCAGCSDEQIANSNKVIDWMKVHHPQDWLYIKAKYTVWVLQTVSILL